MSTPNWIQQKSVRYRNIFCQLADELVCKFERGQPLIVVLSGLIAVQLGFFGPRSTLTDQS